MQTGVFLGLSAALLWGVADFCARGASRAAGTFRTLLFVEIIAIPALLLLTGPFGLIVLRVEQWPMILAAAVPLLYWRTGRLWKVAAQVVSICVCCAS